MEQTYRFLGTQASIGGPNPIELSTFGEKFQLADEDVARSLGSGVQFIPDRMFPDFAAADLATFYAIPLHDQAPAEFIAKRKQAWDALHDWRESVLNPKAKALEVEPIHEKEGEV